MSWLRPRRPPAPRPLPVSPSRVRVPVHGLVPMVGLGDDVLAGDLLVAPIDTTPRAAPFHSPLTGRVVAVDDAHLVVEGKVEPPHAMTDPESEDVVDLLRRAGVVGMGGGMYPTWAKLRGPQPIDVVLVNGCASEPQVTCDRTVLAAHRDEVEDGLELLRAATGARRGRVVTRHRRYVDGWEVRLVERVLGRRVPAGGRPVDVGVLVVNVQTARAVSQAVRLRQPLVQRVLTVGGGAVSEPGDFVVPLGAVVGDVLDACGFEVDRAAVVLAGGPMMGRPVTLNEPVVAGTIALLALTADEVPAREEEPCIRCGRCLEACPLGLPVALLLERPNEEVLRCIGCGACEVDCPSRRRLVERLAAAGRAS